MIKFKDKKFKNYLDIFYYCLDSDIEPNPKWFPGSNHFYIKAHLEEKFNKKFTHKEVKDLISYLQDYAKVHRELVVKELC